jgi:hypothetical protein
MDPRIEYRNPLGPAGADRIAEADRARSESRRRKQNGRRRRLNKEKHPDVDETAASGTEERRDSGRFGKRIDLEA